MIKSQAYFLRGNIEEAKEFLIAAFKYDLSNAFYRSNSYDWKFSYTKLVEKYVDKFGCD